MTPEEMRRRAIDLFTKRFHCSQAMLAVVQEKLNMRDEEAVKAVGAYGGGIAAREASAVHCLAALRRFQVSTAGEAWRIKRIHECGR